MNEWVSKVDGRPLHRYRIADADFQHLKARVRSGLQRKAFQSTASDFVLWASEFYRQSYQGGVLSWSFLTEDLGVILDQTDLREMTKLGLRWFNRSNLLRSGAGVQYLSSLAAEGGIPLYLLAQEGGYRQALLGLVSDLDRFGAGCPHQEALGFAARRTLRLPMGYRTHEFQELFVEFAREISALRQAAPENMPPEEIEGWLDASRPGWADELILRLDGASARSLLSQALGQSRAVGMTSAPILRQIKRNPQGDWDGHIVVGRSTKLPGHLLPFDRALDQRIRLGVIGAASEVRPDLMFALEPETSRNEWVCSRLSGARSSEFAYELDQAIEFIAMADGRYLDRVTLPGADAILIDAMPSLWLFADGDNVELPTRLEYAGNANLTTSDSQVWILLPNDRTLDVDESVEVHSSEPALGGILFRLSGKGRIRTRDWNAKITTKAETTDRDEIVAHGPRSNAIRDASGLPVFLGIPHILTREAGRSFHSPIPRDLRYRVSGSQIWTYKVPTDDYAGKLEVAIAQAGVIGIRTSVQVVPRAAKISLDGSRGAIASGFPAGCLIRLGDTPPVRVNADSQAAVDLGTRVLTHDRLPFAIAGPDGSKVDNWTVFIPRSVPDLTRVDGTVLRKSVTTTPGELRAWNFVGPDGRGSFLGLRYLSGRDDDMQFMLHVPASLPMSGFRNLVDGFLSLGDADAQVRLRAILGTHESGRLTVQRYRGSTKILDDRLMAVDGIGQPDEHALDLEIAAIDLDAPEKTLFFEGTDDQPLTARLGAGRWFLIPKRGGVPLRSPAPLYINHGDHASEQTEALQSSAELREASSHRSRSARVAAFAEALSLRKGQDLQVVEKTIDFLFSQNMSPSVLDPVHALVRLPVQAIQLLLSCPSDMLFERLALELHGGPAWDLISPENWGKAVSRQIIAMENRLSSIPSLATQARDMARKSVQIRMKEILSLRPDLCGHLALALWASQICKLPEVALWLGSLPTSFSAPEPAILEIAAETVRRHGHSAVAFPDLRDPRSPAHFKNYEDSMRGLIEAPIFIASVALGLRAKPNLTQKIQLLQARNLDIAFFDRAVPAAMAFIFGQVPVNA